MKQKRQPRLFKAKPNEIGLKFTGPNTYRNAHTGAMWSVCMPLSDAETTIQKWLFKKLKPVKPSLMARVLGQVKDYSYKPSPFARLLRKVYQWL